MLVSVFIAAPSTWGEGVVNHSGGVVESSGGSVITAESLAPVTTHAVHLAGRAIVMAVLLAVFAVAAFGGTSRRDHDAFWSDPALTLWWVQRRGPPALV
jgi:hypothetical protein